MIAIINPVLEMHEQQEISLPKALLHFLSTKKLLIASYLTSLAYYFVRKTERANCATHPVVATLVRTRAQLDALKPMSANVLLAAKDILASRGRFGAAATQVERPSDLDTAGHSILTLKKKKQAKVCVCLCL